MYFCLNEPFSFLTFCYLRYLSVFTCRRCCINLFIVESYRGPCQTFMIESFYENSQRLKVTIFAKSYIIDI